MREMTNQLRSQAAAEAVKSYAIIGEYDDPNPSAAEVLGDLLGDLRHWAAMVGVNFEICDKNARACFENEVKEEGDRVR
jgi:hypothetical protein